MANIFSASEIIELAIQIEKNGMNFYLELIKKWRGKKIKETLKYLAEEEKKHIASFENMIGSVHKYEPPETYPGEYFDYMNALARSHVFTEKRKGEEVARKIRNPKRALEMGIGFEKDSILFYEGMKKVLLASEHGVVDKIIGEEQTHLRQLLSLIKEL